MKTGLSSFACYLTATDDIDRRIKTADARLRKWIELGSNWSITQSRATNEKELNDDANRFYEILRVAEYQDHTETILAPDTNSIVSEPDPMKYRTIVEDGRFVFLLLRTVLAELDTLKYSHRNPGFREKVQKAIIRIKGWRNQGPLLGGVTVDQSITVRAIGSEPDMQRTLSWLDKDNHDDKIVAAVLEVQSAHPASRVVLVTGDVNLMNKADLAQIETAELCS